MKENGFEVLVVNDSGKLRFKAPNGILFDGLTVWDVIFLNIDVIRADIKIDGGSANSIGTHASVDFFEGFERIMGARSAGNMYDLFVLPAGRFMLGDKLVIYSDDFSSTSSLNMANRKKKEDGWKK